MGPHLSALLHGRTSRRNLSRQTARIALFDQVKFGWSTRGGALFSQLLFDRMTEEPGGLPRHRGSHDERAICILHSAGQWDGVLWDDGA